MRTKKKKSARVPKVKVKLLIEVVPLEQVPMVTPAKRKPKEDMNKVASRMVQEATQRK